MPINQIQLILLVLTSALFAAGFLLGLHHLRRLSRAGAELQSGLPHDASMGPPARAAVATGTFIGLALLIWRAVAQRTFALPVSNPFDAFLLLGLLLAITVIYFRWTRHLRSLSFFLLPMIVILILLGVVLALAHPNGQVQDYTNVWYLLHVITIVAGTVSFSLSCVGSVIYLLADRQLRRKGLDSSHRWVGMPPLASLEKFNQWMIYFGFPLLTISTAAGILYITRAHPGDAAGPSASQMLKIGCGILSWLVYAVLLLVKLNPSFRGRRAAWLSIVGFILFIGAFVAARWS